MHFRSLMPFGSSRSQVPQSGDQPFDPFTAMRREIDRMFDVFSQEGFPAASGGDGFRSPRINVAETERGLELTAELPGVDEKNIDLQIDQGVLMLKAEQQQEKEEKDEKRHYHLVERSSGMFIRRISLPFEPDADHVEATFQKGILKVLVPRSAEAEKHVKKIAIKPA